jgi:hypothetical protein
MKVRRATALVDASPVLEGDITLQAVIDSPVALAMFDLTGAVRLANRAFVEATEGVWIPVANFNELTITRRHPDLQLSFQRVVEGQGPVSSVVLGGPEGGERPTILWMGPLEKDGLVAGVHMTIVVGGTAHE